MQRIAFIFVAWIAMTGVCSAQLPAFTKQGSVLSTPSWLSGTGNKIMYPRIFNNDTYRGTLTGLPASKWSMLFSSDHSSGTGYIGRADATSLTGTWTDSGAAIASDLDQRETPHPVYDPINSRVNVYVHDNVSTVTYGSQAMQLITSTTLAASSFTDRGEVMAYGNHTGYPQVEYDSGDSLFHANSIINGGEAYFNVHSTSANGTSFTRGRMDSYLQQHVAGYGKCFQGVPYTFQYGGRWYMLSNLSPIPRLTSYPSNITAIVAYPIVSKTDLRPIGGYYTLVTPSVTTTDPDYRLSNYAAVYEDGGTLYIFYSGQNNAGDNFVCLATSNGSSASQTAPIINPSSDGTIARGAATTIFNWDAANDAFPTADLTMTASSGSDNSSQSAGNYYEMKYGSGSAQDLRLTGDTTVDPRDYATLEYEIDGLTFDPGDDETTVGIQVGLCNSITTFTRGVVINWGSSTTNQQGRLLVRNGSGSNVTDTGLYAIPYTDTSTNLSEWMRSQTIKLTLRFTENGDKMILLVNDSVCTVRDLSTDGLTWASGMFPYLRIYSAGAHPQVYARFTRMSLKTYSTVSIIDPFSTSIPGSSADPLTGTIPGL
jgi:hypothetical protein